MRSRARSDPVTEPIRRYGVTPDHTTSPVNSTPRSGTHAITSFAVWAGPTWSNSVRRPPSACRVSSSRNVSVGSVSGVSPHSTSGHRWRRPRPASCVSDRVPACATTAARGVNWPLPNVWSPWKWVLTT